MTIAQQRYAIRTLIATGNLTLDDLRQAIEQLLLLTEQALEQPDPARYADLFDHLEADVLELTAIINSEIN